MDFTLRGAAITRSLAVVAAALVAFSLVLQVVRWTGDHQNIFGLLDLFDLDREENVPTLFTTCLLLFAAVLLSTNGALARAASLSAGGWWGLTALFAYFAIDEAWQVHERTIRPLRAMLPAGAPAWTHFTWVLPGALLAAAVAITYVRFLLRLAPATRNAMVIAGCVYLSGALGMELVDGAWAATHGEDNFGYSLLTTIEEALELAGLVLFVRALLNELNARGSPLRFHFSA